MKRYLAIVLLTALALALCLPIIARYEVCAYCRNGRLVEETEKETVTCDVCGKRVTQTTTYMRCKSCKHRETWDVTLSCGH